MFFSEKVSPQILQSEIFRFWCIQIYFPFTNNEITQTICRNIWTHPTHSLISVRHAVYCDSSKDISQYFEPRLNQKKPKAISHAQDT